MTPLVAFLLLLAGTLAWFLLPLVPAIRELLWPTDITPLRVVERDAGDLSLFARGFRTYLRRQLARLPTDAPEHITGELPDHTPYVRGPRLSADQERDALTDAGLDRVVVLTAPTALAGGMSFPRELYASADFVGGPRTMYRAVLGDGQVTIGPTSTVLRWAHAAGDLVVGNGTVLAGRASADGAIRLGSRVKFERLGALAIIVGEGPASPPTPPVRTTPFSLPMHRSRQIGDHLRVEGDLVIPAGESLEGNLVVAGAVTLGVGARVVGDLKAHGTVTLEAAAEVTGAVITRTKVVAGANAAMGGPVVAEVSVELGTGSRVGEKARPTSIATPQVVMDTGVRVCGLITATRGGVTGRVGE